MKRIKKMLSVLLALALMLAGLPLYGMEAQAKVIVPVFEMTQTIIDGVEGIKIYGYGGNGGDVTIPSYREELPIISIGDSAFANCTSVVSVSIPSSVTYIGNNAFKDCSSLERINIPSGVTYIGNYAFKGCSSLKEISIPSSVTRIGKEAFYGCSSLAAITVADDNTKYNSRNNCNAVIETESNTLLYGCKNTKIPSGVTYIGNYAFYGCSDLKEINIPNSVTRIENEAFKGCSSLTELVIPSGVEYIQYGAFRNCSSLERITVAEGNPVYESTDNCNAIIETRVRTLLLGCKNTKIPFNTWKIEYYAFSGCISLTELSIPSMVSSIGSHAFEGCINLEKINIPDSVTFINGGTFEGCSSLKEISIPSGVTDISGNAFKDCSSLEKINVPDKVEYIGGNAFEGCSSLVEISIPSSVTRIEIGAFKDCISLEKINIPAGVTDISGHVSFGGVFEGCISLEKINIPSGVTSIGERAFADCSSLKEISIPAGVTSIGVDAFYGCDSLENITVADDNTKYDSRNNCNAVIETEGNELIAGCKNTNIPGSVTSIGESAFAGNSGLTGIDIPDSVASIKNDAFRSCDSLTGMHIPSGMTSIGTGVFANCNDLVEITVAEDNPEYDSRNNCNAVIKTESNTLIYGCKNTTIPSSVTVIGDGAFMECSSLERINIPSGVTRIGGRAFADCSSLKEINIPDSVTWFGSYAFLACTSLKEIKIPCTSQNYYLNPGSIGYSKYETRGERVKIPGIIICGKRDSVVQEYAEENGFAFRALEANDISWAVVDLETYTYTYDGTEKEPVVTVTMKGETLNPGTDYTVSYDSNIDAGIAEVTITGMGDYLGDVTKMYNISREELSQAEVTLGQESCVYDGTAKTPEVTVMVNGRTLTPGTDYTVSCNDNINAGPAEATITAIGNYTGMVKKAYTIRKADISRAEVTLEPGSYVYDGTAKTPSVTVKLGDIVLVPDRDYTVSYSDNTDAGQAKVTVTGTGNYAEKAEKTYTISKTSISAAEVALEQESYVYDGTAKTPSVTVTLAGKKLVLNTDYTVSYSDNTAAGQAKVTVTGTGIYAGDVEKTYTISEANLSNAEVILEQESYVYDLAAKTPSVTVKLNGNTLVSGRDYTVSYSDNTAAGTAKVTVTGIGSCTGTAEKDFTISKASLSNAEVILEQENYVYDGTAKTPSVTVTMNGKTLTLDRDYTVSYNSNTNVGTAEVTVTGIGSCSGSKAEYFSIVASGSVADPDKTDISPAAVTLDKIIYTYDGTAKTPSVTVMLFGKPLSLNTDYTISYSNNINIGTATVTVEGIGNYTGTKSVNFTIVKTGGNQGQNQGENPGENQGQNSGENQGQNTNSSITCKETVYKVAYGAKPFKINATSKSTLTFTSSSPKIAAVDKNTGTVTIKGTGAATITVKAGNNSVNVTVKVSPKKASLKKVKVSKGKKLTVKWAKDKKASGYQVQISTAKNFKKNVKKKNVKKTSYTFKKLKAGKKYYVRVRSYKKAGTETLYGAWSGKKKSGKVKK